MSDDGHANHERRIHALEETVRFLAEAVMELAEKAVKSVEYKHYGDEPDFSTGIYLTEGNTLAAISEGSYEASGE